MALMNHPDIQVNIKNSDGNTPFHNFCHKFSSPSSVSQVFSLFIAKGVLINEKNDMGEIPLHCAILNQTIRALLVRLLVDHGADVNVPNIHGDSPLHYSVQLRRRVSESNNLYV